MQKTRSGLAAAAAKMQLTDTPEGESSLQSRLNEAERRAQDAEASAQDARAALARTLLEAAQVEAVVTARVKAQSEAELSALRSQLDAVKAASPKRPCADDDLERPRSCDFEKAKTEAPVRPADAPKAASPNIPAVPADEPVIAQSPDECVAKCVTAKPEERLLPPEIPEAAAIDAAQSRLLRLLPPARVAFLSVTAVVAVISYLVASSYMNERRGSPSVAMNAASGVAGVEAAEDRLVQGAATDPEAIAEASATLDAELTRLKSLSKKIAAMRAFVAKQWGDSAPADQAVAADRVATGAAHGDAGWLLFMPVERDALVSYLAGRNWPGIQVAAQGKTAAPRKN